MKRFIRREERFYDLFEALADRIAEDVSNVIEGIVLKYA
jgi:hypothetical protein